jgi:NADH:ubiquinone oxidoreductase subunit 5 (subunit L)/multisubunit Na+/H+ antiporter MnhA subunit
MGILLYLIGRTMVMVLRWEGIRLISMLLIGYWTRREAYGSSYAAVLYNRLGDVGIMYLLLNLDVRLTWVLISVAILRKSAL